MNKTKIFVAHHKAWYIYSDDVCIPIQIGKALSKSDLWIIWDNTWDNISDKNYDYYAELTAQYWVWKNYDLSNVDYVGFCHYRRYMTYWRNGLKFNPFKSFKKGSSFYDWLINIMSYFLWWKIADNFNEKSIQVCKKNILKYLKKYQWNVDALLPKKTFYISESYPLRHVWLENETLWRPLEEIILNKYPDYKQVLSDVCKYRWASRCNMFIAKTDLFKEYEDWLFSIFFEYEQYIKNKNLKHLFLKEHMCTDDHRILWYVSERLLNIFFEYQRLYKNKNIKYEANTLFFK